MQFLYPSFLWALLALAIPIIIHLFYFRRFKKVFFTNVRFLKEIKDETSHRNKLKNLLILLSRCLAVAALVFAFAQPFIPKKGDIKSGINHVSVFIDNSFSMTAKRTDIPLLDYAKSKAKEIVSAYAEEDKFQVITHDFEGRHQRFVNKDDALAFIDEIETTPAVQTIAQVINKQKLLLSDAPSNRISYLISDFQKNITDFNMALDTTIEYNLIPIQTQQDKNISVDSLWFEGPMPFFNQNNKLLIKVTNNSGETAEQVRITLKKDGQEKPISIRDIPANSSIEDTVLINVTASGWNKGVVNVSDYPIQFDDDYYFSFYVPDTIHALVINEGNGNKYINALFSGVSYFNVTNQNASQLQYRQFSKYNLIVLNDLRSITSGMTSALNAYLNDGGKVLVFPGKGAELSTYNSFLATHNGLRMEVNPNSERAVSRLNTDEFVFSDVYLNTSKNLKLPTVKYSFDIISGAQVAEERLAFYRDGGSFLSKYNVGNGQLFVCSAPLSEESNDLVFNSEVFVPMIYKIAISSGQLSPIAYTIGQNEIVTVKNLRDKVDYTYIVTDGNISFIPGQFPKGNQVALDLSGQIKTSGFYDVLLDETLVSVVGMNYDRKESNRALYTESDLKENTKNLANFNIIGANQQADLSTTVTQKDKGITLWKWFVILTLVFLALEILLVRLL